MLAGVVALALLATTTGLVVQWQRASDAQARAKAAEDLAEQLAEEVEELQATVEALEAQAAGDDPTRDRTDLGGMLEGLLDDDGPMGDLLAGGAPGAACMDPGTGMLDGMLGGGHEPPPDDPDALVEVVAEQVAELRELEWDEPAEVDFVDDAELSDRLDALLDGDTDPAAIAAQQRLLTALGAVPDDLDLEQLQRDLLEDQVAGYYVPETGELVVRVPDDGTIRPFDRVTLAHELEHALADQVLGLPDVLDEPALDDADARLGALGLIEGDATLLMNHWALEHLSLTDQLGGLLSGDLDAAQASLATVPHHLQRELLFPYTDGLDYVCELVLDGGWAAVDERYASPPRTSLEILHPHRDGEAPRTPTELTAPEPAEQVLHTTLGAAPLLWLLEAPGGDPARGLDDARDRVEAWAGGEVELWERAGESVVGITLVDRDGDGTLCDALGDWHVAAFDDHQPSRSEGTRAFRGTDRSAALRCEGETVRYASAGDLPTALRVVGTG